jgi:hypothetical protein
MRINDDINVEEIILIVDFVVKIEVRNVGFKMMSEIGEDRS